MRTPDKSKDLALIPNIYIQKMDVTDPNSIQSVINFGVEKFGKIDILINNAGIGVLGAFETTDEDLIRKQFETNVFGVMNTIKNILPHFRKNRSGMIINISSGVGIIPIPVQSVYDATKFTIEGFSESLYYELEALGVSVKIVQPGATKSNFFQSVVITDTTNYPDYQNYQKKVIDNVVKSNNSGLDPTSVAAVIYKAATDGRNKLRYTAGKDVSLFSKVRWILPANIFMKIVKRNFDN
jgi:short-subunit dehydrogenase